MNDSEKNIDIQKRLFEEIQKNLPEQYVLVDIVSDVLNTGLDSAYRRIRCEKLLSIKEAYTLCKHFKISFDLLMHNKNIHQFNCDYRPVNISMPNEYYNYMLALSKNVEKLKTSGDSNILMSANDIPFFHLTAQKELRLFKVYTWFNSVYNYADSLDNFMKEIDTPELVGCHQKISKDYEFIPSAEIWTEDTINPTLRLINYYVDICMFSGKELPLQLCEQVLSILDKLQIWAGNSGKGAKATPFQLYLSEMELENTYILMRRAEMSNCVVKLFTINSLNVYDKDFCMETEHWLTKLSERSTLLSGNSEKERIHFFNSQRQKVHLLMEKIEKSF